MSDNENIEPTASPESEDVHSLVGTPDTTAQSKSGSNDASEVTELVTRKRPEAKCCSEPLLEKEHDSAIGDTQKECTSNQSQGGWGYWGSWGKSLLTTASATVASVGHGISHVIEKAESSLGIPSPEELSTEAEKEEDLQKDGINVEESCPAQENESASPISGAFGVFSAITHVVQNTGKTVITGGLDALEFLGKKTMDVIAEGDPGFKTTKGLMSRNSTLSQDKDLVLRTAWSGNPIQVNGKNIRFDNDYTSTTITKRKECVPFIKNLKKADIKAQVLVPARIKITLSDGQKIFNNLEEAADFVKKRKLLDKIEDMDISLPSLERQAINGKLSTNDKTNKKLKGCYYCVKSVLAALAGEDRETLKQELEEIKEAFSLVEFDDEDEDVSKIDDEEFVKELTELLAELRVTTSPEKLAKARKAAYEWIADVHANSSSEKEIEKEEQKEEGFEHTSQCVVEDIHNLAIRSLAELTARSIEQFHKIAALVLHGQEGRVSSVVRAKSLAQMTIMLCKEVSALSKQFTSCLTTSGMKEKADVLNPLITTVFLEASNSASYIQDAFQLLQPVLEISHIQTFRDFSQQ
ncbi:protein FAM114A2 [Protopterus annectens]|uniref:protein FAM114A2 n=1 Tax=Protopterus annectens TaxID=7888 RepID=UPI001CFA24DE|nr:protein FAM114A2 [Protopterus annectens]